MSRRAHIETRRHLAVPPPCLHTETAIPPPKFGKAKEVLGPVIPLESEQDLFSRLASEFVPPSKRAAGRTLVPLPAGAAASSQ